MNVSVIIPAFNEADSIKAVLNDIKKKNYSWIKEIIVVDDGSQDNTYDLAVKSGVKVIKHHENLGYGASLKTGIDISKEDYIFMMDADGQHRTEDINVLYNQLGDNDIVIGARTNIMGSPLWRIPGKWLIKILAQLLLNRKLPDPNSGLRLAKAKYLKNYKDICPDGFSFSTTITFAFHFFNHKVKYVPIEVLKRKGKSSVSIITGFKTILLVLNLITLFHPLRIFLPTSLIMFIFSVFWGVPYFMAGKGLTMATLLLLMSSMIIFFMGLIAEQISSLRLERLK